MKKLLKTILATMLIISTFSGIPSVYANDDTQGENTATIEEVQQVETALEDEPETKEVVEQPVEESVVTTEPQPIENVDNIVTNENEEKSEPVVTFKVTFIGHDETVLGEQDVNAGETAIAPETPSIEGLEFIGWDKDFANIQEALTIKALYEAPTTDNNALEESNSKTRQSNVNFWDDCDDDDDDDDEHDNKEVYIHYISGEGSTSNAISEYVKKGEEIKILSIEETGFKIKEGYTFAYWEETDSKDRYYGNETVELDKKMNLKAVYTYTSDTKVYKVTYNGNGENSGSVTDEQKYDYYDEIILLNNEFIKDKAVFIGWSEFKYDDFGQEPIFSLLQPNNSLYTIGNTTLYAVWAVDVNVNGTPDYKEKYHITYDLNGGKGKTPIDHITYTPSHNEATIKNNQFAWKHGYKFLGWNTDKDAVEASVQPGETVTVPDNIKYYAIWGAKTPEPETYRVIYDGNGETSGEVIDNGKYEFDDTVTLQENRFKKDQAVFIGWSTEKYDIVKSEDELNTKTIYSAGDQLQMPEGVLTIYAVWAEDLNGNDTEDYNESFMITTSIDEYGTIDSGAEDLALYSDFTVNFNANLGYKIDTVTVDDKTLGEDDYYDSTDEKYVYEFTNIEENHIIDVTTVIDDAQTKAVNVKYIKEDRQLDPMDPTDPTDITTLNVQVLDEFIAKGTVDEAIEEYEAENADIFNGYILESVTPEANEDAFELNETGATDIIYTYVADGNGDEIPDKYQVIFNYQISNDEAATLSGTVEEYVTRLLDDEYSTEVAVSPEANIEYTTNPNYRLVDITDDKLGTYESIDAIKEATFDKDTTFTLNFEYVAPVAPTPVPTPGPTTPPNEGCPAGTVWNDANQSCEVIQQPVIVEPIIVPIPAPEPEEEVVIDDLTPEVAPAPTATPETIEDDLTPEVGRGSWALINLLSALGTMVLAIILLFVKNKKDEENDEENMNEEDTKAAKRNKMYKALSIAVAVLSVIVFVLTENITLKMVYVDKYTVVMIALLVVNAICFFVGRKGEEQVEDSDQVNS